MALALLNEARGFGDGATIRSPLFLLAENARSQMRIAMLILMVCSGMALGAQIVMNTRVRVAMQSPVMGATVSLAVTAVVLGLLIALGLFGGAGNTPSGLKAIPPWAWFGGVCGALYLVAAVI